MKWTHPGSGATRVFRGDDLSVRFLRSYVADLFSAPEHALEGQLRGPGGQVIEGYQTVWSTAASATLTPDEQRWRRHLGAVLNTGAADGAPPDDLLELRRTGPGLLEPNARHELVVLGGEGGQLLFEDGFAGDAPDAAWGEDTTGWSVGDGELSRTAGADTLRVGDVVWRDIDVTVELRDADRAAGVVFRCSRSPANGGLATERCYRLAVTRTSATLEQVGAQVQKLAEANHALTPGDWYRFRLSVVGDRIRVWRFAESIFDLVVPAAADGSPALRAGQVGLHSTSTTARFRRLQVRQATLLRVSFVTSAFERFSDLIESALTRSETADVTTFTPRSVTAAAPDSQLVDAAVVATDAWASAQHGWEQDLVNLRDKVSDRKQLEASKLELRERKALMDSLFRMVCRGAGITGFDPIGQRVEVVNLRHPDTAALRGVWVRSPETLDLRRAVDGDHVGRTELTLETRSSPGLDWQPLEITLVHDADATQVLLLLTEPAAALGAEIALTLTYHRDHGDEAGTGDHRFDRAVERLPDGTDRDSVRLVWGY